MKTAVKQRVEWIDVAKAMSILMVTMLHVGQLAQAAEINVGRIVELNAFLAPIRMPLFFAASGVFAGSALRKSWSDLLRHKVALFVWLFVIWTCVRWGFCAAVLPNPDNPNEGTYLSEIGWALLMPTTGLWFLWCLAIFFVVAKALRQFDARLTVGLAVIVSVVSLMIADAPAQAGEDGLLANLAHRNSLRYFAFFYGAAMFPDIVKRLGTWKMAPGVIAMLACFTVFYALTKIAPTPIAATARFAASISGVALLFLCARPLDAFGPTSRALRYLGLNTLPIYVAQVPLIVIYLEVLEVTGIATMRGVSNLIVPTGVLLVVAGTLLLRDLLIRLGAGVMYRLPRFETARPEQAAA
ncbi:acyltransferase family protein [Sphingomonas sp. Leaf10]|uniref:acyltransferase family protein n=1 Tax=Sphingomonas sp. Leaf10 TaxID=1735676 RepID=UPI0006F1E358|nr:acyltransferase [Sphingomonas sp. Leaf10]KQM37604.1 hypothetical protein ASE59_14045 [Sphingomonas sp. Leaf10]